MAKLTVQQAKAICDGMNKQRMERIQGDMRAHTDTVDASLCFKEDFILYPTNHEEDEIIDQGT